MVELLKRVIFSLSLRRFNHINILKTLFYNFLLFDLKTAIKLPIYIYNDVDILHCKKIILNGDIHRGMIRIGNWKYKSFNRTRIINTGTLIFNGDVDIWGGCIVENSGKIEFGGNVIIAENCKIICSLEIIFGDCVSVGYETTFMDTDYHYIIFENDIVHRNEKGIFIGRGSWISSNCKLMKGTRIPQNSVVGGGAMLNRDFSDMPEQTIFIGTPAKPSKYRGRRLFNRGEGKKIKKYFRENLSKTEYQLSYDDIDEMCFSHFFNTRK